MTSLPLTLPPLNENGPIPIWLGNSFKVGDQKKSILEYSENFQGWNDSLTHFLDIHAGENHAIDRASRQHTINQIKRFAPKKNPVILEVGCSSGLLLKQMQNELPDAILMGADITYEPLMALTKSLPNVPLMRFDLTNCPLHDNSVDVVVLLNILEHIENDSVAFQQVYRILKPGGIAIIEVPANPELYDLHDKLLLHFRRYSLNKLISLAKTTGFSILKKSHLGCFIYPGFWFIKNKNRRTKFESDEHKKQIIEKNISYTRENFLLRFIIKLELMLGTRLAYPFGIRCLLTVKK